jgi:hypothetical protein
MAVAYGRRRGCGATRTRSSPSERPDPLSTTRCAITLVLHRRRHEVHQRQQVPRLECRCGCRSSRSPLEPMYRIYRIRRGLLDGAGLRGDLAEGPGRARFSAVYRPEKTYGLRIFAAPISEAKLRSAVTSAALRCFCAVLLPLGQERGGGDRPPAPTPTDDGSTSLPVPRTFASAERRGRCTRHRPPPPSPACFRTAPTGAGRVPVRAHRHAAVLPTVTACRSRSWSRRSSPPTPASSASRCASCTAPCGWVPRIQSQGSARRIISNLENASSAARFGSAGPPRSRTPAGSPASRSSS